MNRTEYLKKDLTFDERIEFREKYSSLKSQIFDLTSNLKGFNVLSKTQQTAIRKIAMDMYKAYKGDEFIASHYEIFEDNTAGDPIYKKYRDAEKQGMYLAIESTSTLKALEKRGYIEIVEVGGSHCDTVRVLFEINFDGIEL